MNDRKKSLEVAKDVERRLKLEPDFRVRVIDPKGKSTEEILAELADFAVECGDAEDPLLSLPVETAPPKRGRREGD